MLASKVSFGLMVGATIALLSCQALAGGTATTRIPSSQERQDKSIVINAEPLGPMIDGKYGLGATTGASVGVFLDKDSVLRAALRTNSSCDSGPCGYTDDSLSLTMQHFLGNSFFVEVGVMGQSSIERYAGNYQADEAPQKQHHYQASWLGAVAGFGSQWQWRSFTLGARWAQGYAPLARVSSQVLNGDLGGAPVTSADQARARALGQQGRVWLPTLLIGWSIR